MKNLIVIILFFPIGLFAQGNLEVVSDSTVTSNNGSFEVVQTEEGTLIDAYYFQIESEASTIEAKGPGAEPKNNRPLFISFIPEIKD